MVHFAIQVVPPSVEAEMRQKGIWQSWCPVPLTRLRLLTLSYIDFTGTPRHDGQLMVLDAVAPKVVGIFRSLFEDAFPIASMSLINRFNGDDNASMEANNSSAFNCRVIAGSSKISLHAYGVAIDINPVQNPCIVPEDPSISPKGSDAWADRSKQHAGMVEPIIPIFQEYGFNVWGGAWTTPIDFQHFQIPREMAEQLILMSEAQALQTFDNYCAGLKSSS